MPKIIIFVISRKFGKYTFFPGDNDIQSGRTYTISLTISEINHSKKYFNKRTAWEKDQQKLNFVS